MLNISNEYDRQYISFMKDWHQGFFLHEQDIIVWDQYQQGFVVNDFAGTSFVPINIVEYYFEENGIDFNGDICLYKK